MVPHLGRLLPPKALLALPAKKLCDSERAEGQVCTVRTYAAQCLWQLAGAGSDVTALFPDKTKLFQLLDAAKGAEAEALQELILALLQANGLGQLPSWLQALRQVVLALPPKAGGAKEESTTNRKGSEDRIADEVDDEASFAGPKQEPSSKQKLSSCTATKVFAVSCVQLLLEQVSPKDSAHFQPDGMSPSELSPEKRFISHLELLVGIAVNAASSEAASLAAAGLRLMLLVVGRFQHTKDVQGQVEGVDCPLLLVQFEAQMTTCIRHGLSCGMTHLFSQTVFFLLRSLNPVVMACVWTEFGNVGEWFEHVCGCCVFQVSKDHTLVFSFVRVCPSANVKHDYMRFGHCQNKRSVEIGCLFHLMHRRFFAVFSIQPKPDRS